MSEIKPPSAISEDNSLDGPLTEVDTGQVSKKKGRFHGWKLTIFSIVVLVAVVINGFTTVPYYILSPGKTVSAGQFVKLPAERDKTPNGQVMLTTVSISTARPFDLVWARFNDGSRIEKKKAITGQLSQRQFDDLSAKQMTGSQMAAEYVAFERSGFQVELVGKGALVDDVLVGSPADGQIKPGEVIKKVDSVDISLGADLTKQVRAHKPGESVTIVVEDTQGQLRTLQLKTASLPKDINLAYLGVNIVTKGLELKTPFDVSYVSTEIGGPSAGLAFTLAMIDRLTPGELTGGGKIAATGTIDGEGHVGEVGGIEQKTLSVKKSGASVFLVPAAEVKEAKKYSGGKLKVLGVDNLEQAIQALASIGGDISELPPSSVFHPTSD